MPNVYIYLLDLLYDYFNVIISISFKLIWFSSLVAVWFASGSL